MVQTETAAQKFLFGPEAGKLNTMRQLPHPGVSRGASSTLWQFYS